MLLKGGPANSGTRFMPAGTTEKKDAWTCAKGHENKGYWINCMTQYCRERRPH